MSHLRDSVAAAIAKINEPHAIIVDDEQPYADLAPPEAWVAFREELLASPEAHASYSHWRTADGTPDEQPITKDEAQQILSKVKEPSAKLLAAAEAYSKAKHFLGHLRDMLKDLGFHVTLHARAPKIEAGSPPFLVLVDFHFEGESYEGQSAEQTVQALMHPAVRVPPFVLLMSKRLDLGEWQKWRRVAENVGFFQFNYDFLPKQRIENSASHLYFALLSFVQHAPVSETYFNQMRLLERESQSISAHVCRELFQVTPQEAGLFGRRMQVEGVSLAAAFADLFIDILTKRIRASADLRDAMSAFESAVSTQGLPTPDIEESGILHRIYSELLHVPATDGGGPPQFGDIYVDDQDRMLLVISQECDLSSGLGRAPKIDRVLLLEGEIKSMPAGEQDGAYISKPFTSDDKKQVWIWWGLTKPVVVPYAAFFPAEDGNAPARLARQYCLRFADADEIQNAYAFHIARVATEVLPSPVEKVSVTMAWENEDGTGTIGDIQLVFLIVAVGEERFISLSRESKVPSLGGDREFFTPQVAVKLSQMVALSEFRELIASCKIFAVGSGNRLATLLKCPKNPRGVSPWKG